MASINFGSTANSRPYCTLTVTQSSQSIANNTSTVSYSLVLHRPSAISSSATKKWSCTINGVVHNGSGSIGGSGNKTLLSGTQVISHNGDGKKSISFSASCELKITWGSVSLGTISGSGSVSLTTIPRASGFGTIGGSTTIGNVLTISVDRKSSAFTTSLWYSFGGVSWAGVVSQTSSTNISFTLPMSLCSQIPNSTSGTMTLIMRTYNGSAQIGNDVTKSITIYVPGSVVPSFSSLSLTGVNLWNGAYVKTHSKVTASIVGAVGSYGSTIRSYLISGPNLSVSSSSGTSSVLTSSGILTYTATITDSRGRTASRTNTISVKDYSYPTASVTAVRGNYDKVTGKFTEDIILGQTLKVVPTFTYASAIVNIKSAVVTSNNLSSSVTSSGHIIYLGVNKEFEITSAYTVTFTFTDQFNNTATATTKIASGKFIMNVLKDTGVSFGCAAELGKFKVGMPTQFESQILGQLAKSNASTSWYLGRNTAFIRNTVGSPTGWCSLASMKTPVGSWEMGTLGENLYFSYVKDSDFNAGTNASVTVGIQPSKNIIATMTWANITGKPSTFSPSNHSHSYATWLGAQYASGGEWLGFYNKYGGTRKGWIGHDGTNVLRITNEAGSTVYINCDMQIPNGSKLWSKNTSGSSTYLAVMGTNNVAYFGDNSYQNCLRGTKVYLGSSGATVTSDRNLKYDIEPIKDEYVELFKKLKPINYKYINGGAKRPHIGFIAQDIEDSLKEIGMTSNDFAGLCIDEASSDGDEDSGWDGNYLVKNGFSKMYTLIYEEFIALNTHMIQKIYKKVDDQQNEIDNLKNEIDELKKIIKELL